MSYCRLELTCADKGEADKIANTLLVKHLVACAKQIPVKSDYRWQGKIERASENLVVMESKLELFDKVEKEVVKLHSYDTFVLTAIPLAKISTKAEKWLAKELR
ncbi:MAG TPA: divalent-cation tolerance protein CutA [Candidatus Saccharimonadales bacterium]|nr:divalent-cation tolerance protein CutA [Candidatus Saccharimonadales bacterium]